MARILIVDDNLLIRSLLREILVDGGHTVVGEARDGLEAPVMLRDCKPDLVTLDLVMPGRGGLQTLKHLMMVDCTLPFVICSASLTEHNVLEAIKLGAQGFIIKPFERKAVLDAVRAALSRQSGVPGNQHGATQTQPGVIQTQPGVIQTQPGVIQTQSGVTRTQPGVTQTQPGVTQIQSGATQTQFGAPENQSGIPLGASILQARSEHARTTEEGAHDQREFERVDIALRLRLQTHEGWLDTVTVNLSGSGMLVEGDTLEIDERVQFKLYLEDGDLPVAGLGRVVRLDGFGRAGLAFERVRMSDHERLVRYMQERRAQLSVLA